jgi:hypothetical protein
VLAVLSCHNQNLRPQEDFDWYIGVLAQLIRAPGCEHAALISVQVTGSRHHCRGGALTSSLS